MSHGFHGVYLLCTMNDSFKTSVKGTYIGYTVLPSRRILQHNRFKKGGANKTARYGPWDMVLIVHNFPNNVSALRFEWAWQNPTRSNRLKHFNWDKKRGENGVKYQVRVAEKMLNIPPWNKLPLVLQWLNTDYSIPISPAIHIPIVSGPIESDNLPGCDVTILGDDVISENGHCEICDEAVSRKNSVYCLRKQCVFHMTCLAKAWTTGNLALVPLLGTCPSCGYEQLWGHMINFKEKSLTGGKQSQSNDVDDWTDLLSQKA